MTRRKPFWNVVKFFRGPMTSPSVIVWKRNQPMMVNMKYMRPRRMTTFPRDGKEKTIVWIIA